MRNSERIICLRLENAVIESSVEANDGQVCLRLCATQSNFNASIMVLTVSGHAFCHRARLSQDRVYQFESKWKTKGYSVLEGKRL